ncbi:ribosome biogenesis GTP-binding protein YihA/YsxC [soil metagenome]
MKITSAEFVRSSFSKEHWVTDGLPEIAFLGRSNVGKSSLINSLLLRKGLARTSNTPGRTQSINFFIINGSFYFADLPGYGYAKVSKVMRADWGKMAEEYLAQRDELALCVQLIDSRHKPSPLDVQLNEWLLFNEKPHIIVATKSDKLSKNEMQKSLASAREVFAHTPIIAYSAQSGTGRDGLWSVIAAAIN